MATPFTIVFLVVGLTALIAVGFILWVIVLILRGVGRGLGRLAGMAMGQPRVTAGGLRCCVRVRCGAVNPASANFCRRCGTPLMRGTNRRRVPLAA